MSWARLPSVRIGAVVAIALGAAFVVWLLVRGNDDSSTASPTTTAATPSIGPVAASLARLHALSAKTGHPTYWVGPRRGQRYELTRTAGDRVFVRYLPAGVAVGNRRADYTIVGTYPTPRALKVLRNLAKQPGEKSAPVPGGGIAVYGISKPTNVYVAYPGSNVQIEVFDPSSTRALLLATSGRVVPVG